MEEKKKIKIGTIINIIAIIVIVGLVGVLFSSNAKIKSLKNELNEIKGTDKKEITAEEFKSIILTKGFNISVIEDAISKDAITSAGIKKGYLTKEIEDEEYRINFFELEDENSEQYMYYNSIDTVRKESNWNLTETLEKSMKHTKYTAVSNGNYIVISRIGNTLVWGTINADEKQKLIDLLDEIGY